MESFEGVGPDFAPVEYIRELSAWCKKHNVVLIFDEVQAGFGRRTVKQWLSIVHRRHSDDKKVAVQQIEA